MKTGDPGGSRGLGGPWGSPTEDGEADPPQLTVPEVWADLLAEGLKRWGTEQVLGAGGTERRPVGVSSRPRASFLCEQDHGRDRGVRYKTFIAACLLSSMKLPLAVLGCCAWRWAGWPGRARAHFWAGALEPRRCRMMGHRCPRTRQTAAGTRHAPREAAGLAGTGQEWPPQAGCRPFLPAACGSR